MLLASMCSRATPKAIGIAASAKPFILQKSRAAPAAIKLPRGNLLNNGRRSGSAARNAYLSLLPLSLVDMETIELIVGGCVAAVIAPFAFLFFTRAIQTIGSTRAQETASEAVDDDKQATK